MENSTALARPNQQTGIVLDYGYDRIEKTVQLCERIARSGMVPKAYQNAPEKVFVAGAMGATFGLDVFQAMQGIGVINGHPGFYGDALIGIVRGQTDQEQWTLEGVKAMEYAADYSEVYKKWLDKYEWNPSKIAFCVTKRKDRDEPVIQYFTIHQAHQAELLKKDNWQNYPVRMLQMRARSFAIRDAYPEILMGYKTFEELQDHKDDLIEPESMPEATGSFVETKDWNEVEKIKEEPEKPKKQPQTPKQQGGADGEDQPASFAEFDQEQKDEEIPVEPDEAHYEVVDDDDSHTETPPVSTDWNADIAIEHIQISSKKELIDQNFLTDTEQRVTVLRAWDEKFGTDLEKVRGQADQEPEEEEKTDLEQEIDRQEAKSEEITNDDLFADFDDEEEEDDVPF